MLKHLLKFILSWRRIAFYFTGEEKPLKFTYWSLLSSSDENMKKDYKPYQDIKWLILTKSQQMFSKSVINLKDCPIVLSL